MAEYGLAFDEISEEGIQEEGQDRKRQRTDTTDAFCDICFMKNLIVLSKNVAFYLCYLCERYLCDKCFRGHESHKYAKLLSEKRESDGQLDSFLDEMMNENEREELLEREEMSIVDRVDVKHKNDQNEYCYITGLCGLNNTRWIVCDLNNYCVKIFSAGSNILQRYIRFGSEPWGVTEIFVSAINQAQPDKQCLLAVTLPWEYRILFIDVTRTPAVITKSIETEKRCCSIDFSEEMIFALCGVYVEYHDRWFVSVMSTDGDTIHTINIDLHTGWSDPYLAVCRGRIYITHPDNNKVFCINDKGKEISHIIINGSWPKGISVDPDTYKVYICARDHDKLYMLDFSLESHFGFKSVNLEKPKALCFQRDKLYVGHVGSNHDNFVTVVGIL